MMRRFGAIMACLWLGLAPWPLGAQTYLDPEAVDRMGRLMDTWAHGWLEAREPTTWRGWDGTRYGGPRDGPRISSNGEAPGPYPPESPARRRLQGVWISNAGDVLIVAGDRFQLSNTDQQYLFGRLRVRGDQLTARIPATGASLSYTLFFGDDQFVARDNRQGRVLFFKRVTGDQPYPLVREWGSISPRR